MKKKIAAESNVWDPVPESASQITGPVDYPVPDTTNHQAESQPQAQPTDVLGFDMEGLMTDFPTARDLEKFVYDQTGVVLNLKGRANRLKYQVALDTLNGKMPATEFMGSENPYLDRNELIPTEPMRPVPERDPALESAGVQVNKFDTNLFPHPDPEWKAQDQNCSVCFRKYSSGAISYEILGPIALRAVGTRINKYGKEQPEKYVWVDPRNGEQIIRTATGIYTPLGTKLRAFMRRQRFNRSNQWDQWIDRDFVVADEIINDNPWATE